MTPDQAAPTAEEQQKITEVGMAGGEAAAAAATPEQASADARKAMREKADQVKLELSDEQIEQIAEASVDKMISQMEQRGAFDPPPDPVQPPPTAPPAPGEQPQPIGQDAPAPRKKTWAERFQSL